jgi:hypothetical protein
VKRGAGKPDPTAADDASRFREVLRLADQEAIAKGVTSFQDAGEPFGTIDALRSAVDRGDLRVRLWVMVQGGVAELSDKLDRYRTIGHGNDMLTVRAIKVYADGAMGSRGAWLLQPYATSRTAWAAAARHGDAAPGCAARGRAGVSARGPRNRRSRQPRGTERLRGGLQGRGPLWEGPALARSSTRSS